MTSERQRSPYEEAGGEEAILRVLDDLYTQLFDDALVGFLFAGHDKARIVREQAVFVRRMLGDRTAVYRGKSIPDAHAELPILPGHFDRRHWLLREVLVAHGIPERAREAWLSLDLALRDVILKVGQVRIEELRWKDDDDDGE
jgi:hemoglobin